MNTLRRQLQEVLRYPSAIIGMALILILIVTAVTVVFVIPYPEAVRLWRGGEDVWYRNPKNAAPVWVNVFRAEDLPGSYFLSTKEQTATKTVVPSDSGDQIQIVFEFDYPYEGFPQEITVYFSSVFESKQPFVSLTWLIPDGRKIAINNFSVGRTFPYRLTQDTQVQRKFTNMSAQKGLFFDINAIEPVAVRGTYKLIVDAITFEKGSDVDAELVIFGQVSGWAGTDHRRRDLGVALLWGIPIALAFGLLAALGTTVTTMIISAIGTWFGGWVDETIQRITEVNLVLPFLPIMLMIGTFYSRSIWTILGATIALSIFGGGIKTYRAIFLQIKESAYIEAAQAYGASSWRIIMRYLTPRIIPLLIPQLVVLIPTYVFLEASLAVLGLGDPVLPTWGKIIYDAESNGALYQGQYYWILEPAFLLMLTGMAFAMLGFSLDRIFNPRLRGQ